MPTANRTQIAPDFEERNLLANELLEHLRLDPAQVEVDSLVVTINEHGDRGPDGRHLVTWHGHARISTATLARLANLADAKADAQ